ncbi:MAG: hypothetical protein HQL72_12820 [Magnetococcales bacterium]|nr:hypothetical protein [Magnetococcales bacterium]
MRRRPTLINPWLLGALIWGGFSLLIIKEHFRVSGGGAWQEMWFLCSLFWFQFGFGRILISLFRGQRHQLRDQLLITLIPPVILYLLIAPSILPEPPHHE